MLTCARCGRENPAPARFCNACGAPLPVELREVRKKVTVVFADLSGSTALGERLNPEALRGVMRRYHAALRTILERHGGTVEKFVGDAVMAVFGLPHVHEDDALCAVRAAAEMRDAVEALVLGAIRVLQGEVVGGRRLYTGAREISRDLGRTLWAAATALFSGTAELAAGDLATAESELRQAASELEEMGARSLRSTVIALLARTLCLQGRDDEAEPLVEERLAVSADDLVNQIICGGVKARIAARRGNLDTAVALAEEAVARTVADGVETIVQPDTYMDLAEVMRLAGRRDREVAALREALRLYEQKGSVASAARARSLLELAAS